MPRCLVAKRSGVLTAATSCPSLTGPKSSNRSSRLFNRNGMSAPLEGPSAAPNPAQDRAKLDPLALALGAKEARATGPRQRCEGTRCRSGRDRDHSRRSDRDRAISVLGIARSRRGLAGSAGDEGGDDVRGVPVMGLAGSVVAHRRPWLARRPPLARPAGHAGVEGGGDGRMTQAVRRDPLRDLGPARQPDGRSAA